jgi:hypothetical protein
VERKQKVTSRQKLIGYLEMVNAETISGNVIKYSPEKRRHLETLNTFWEEAMMHVFPQILQLTQEAL